MKSSRARWFSSLGLVLAGLVLPGCTSPHVWMEDSASNTNDLLKIAGDWETGYRVYIVKVDEKAMRCSPLLGLTQTAFVKPGPHTLFVGYENELSHAFRTIRFVARPGQSYAIHRRLEGYTVKIWLQESGN